MSQPSPYSAAVEATVAARDARIRELEAELQAARRGLSTLGTVLESLAERLTEEEATTVAQVMAGAVRPDRARELEAQLTEVKATVRAVADSAIVRGCEICGRLATVASPDDSYCEHHASLAGRLSDDLPHAPAWRRLVAMVKGHGR